MENTTSAWQGSILHCLKWALEEIKQEQTIYMKCH